MNQAVRSRRLPASMRGALLLLVLAVLLPLLFVQAGIYIAWYYSRWSEQELATLDTAREAAATFEAYIRDVRRQELAIGTALTGPHSYTPDEANLFLTVAGRDYPSTRSWNWSNREGTVIASSRAKMIGLKLGDRAYFQKLRRGRSWVVSDLLVDRLTGARMFVIASRIDDRKGSLAGAIIAMAEVTDLGERAVALYHTIGEELAVFDRQGILVYNSREPRKLFQDWRTFDLLLAGALQSGTQQVGVMDLPNDAELSEKYIAARVPVGNTRLGGRRPPPRGQGHGQRLYRAVDRRRPESAGGGRFGRLGVDDRRQAHPPATPAPGARPGDRPGRLRTSRRKRRRPRTCRVGHRLQSDGRRGRRRSSGDGSGQCLVGTTHF